MSTTLPTMSYAEQCIYAELMGLPPPAERPLALAVVSEKRGRGRPKKVIDPNAPVPVKRPPGRPPGSKKDAAVAQLDEKQKPLAYLLALKDTPIDFNASGADQAAVIKIRRESAIACLPYTSPRLEAVELSATVKRPIWVLVFRDGTEKEIYGKRS
jgi:hypothetical protein